MEILTAAQMLEADRRTIDAGTPSLELMERAGVAIVDALARELPELWPRGAVIVCGKGNNGGDGLVILRHLKRRGVDVTAIVLATRDQVSVDSRANWERAEAAGCRIVVAEDETAWQRAQAAIDPQAWIIDAMLGTGARGPLQGLIATAVQSLHGRDCVAVDLPTGIDADDPCTVAGALQARWTFALARPKPAHAIDPAALVCGEIRILDIGIPDATIAELGSRARWQTAESLRGIVPARQPRDHKGTFGHLLIVAGSTGRAGAAVLSARGALRGGVGLVTVAAPASVRPEIAVQQSECMTEPLQEEPVGAIAAAATARIQELLAPQDALALGPGLGTAEGTVKAVRSLAVGARRPTVIDADGLNALAGDGRLLRTLRDAAAPRILTPHPGEAARLLGSTIETIQRDRRAAVTEMAELSGAVVVLKGCRTLIARPDGQLAVNVGGNPGMASAGSGDLLTGLTGALLARGLDAFDAARVAVYLHAEAGDQARDRVGEESLIAGDIEASLAAAWRTIQ